MYLKKKWGFSTGFSLYKVERETECFYFVRYNENYVERISKKKMSEYSEWSIPTKEDLETYKKRLLVSKLEKLIKATDFEKWNEDKLKNLVKIIEEGGKK